MKLHLYQSVAIAGSLLLMVSGMLRFSFSGSPKELVISILYFIANVFIFCF
ncbi:MAG: hypothetical protein NT079_05960 [Candidatus Omnitrophica bacterium]|nr:hypothetical protein [Candidatus Omnitrophota bacterium]